MYSFDFLDAPSPSSLIKGSWVGYCYLSTAHLKIFGITELLPWGNIAVKTNLKYSISKTMVSQPLQHTAYSLKLILPTTHSLLHLRREEPKMRTDLETCLGIASLIPVFLRAVSWPCLESYSTSTAAFLPVFVRGIKFQFSPESFYICW